MKLGVTAVMLPELDFDEQLALCASLGVTCYQFRPRVISDGDRGKAYSNWGNHKFDLTPERFAREGAALTAKLRTAGMEPWGSVPVLQVDSPEDAMVLHLEGARVSGAARVRCQPPNYPSGPFRYNEYLDATVARYREVIEKYSRPRGVKLIIETHALSAASGPGLAWNIVKNFSPADVAVIFDIANFNREGELRPNLAVAVLRDHIDCVHIGGFRRAHGAPDTHGCQTIQYVGCPMEQADTYIPDWVAALKAAGVDAPLIIEDYEGGVSGAQRLTRSANLLRKLVQL